MANGKWQMANGNKMQLCGGATGWVAPCGVWTPPPLLRALDILYGWSDNIY